VAQAGDAGARSVRRLTAGGQKKSQRRRFLGRSRRQLSLIYTSSREATSKDVGPLGRVRSNRRTLFVLQPEREALLAQTDTGSSKESWQRRVPRRQLRFASAPGSVRGASLAQLFRPAADLKGAGSLSSPTKCAPSRPGASSRHSRRARSCGDVLSARRIEPVAANRVC
jgi:hypothetical protein